MKESIHKYFKLGTLQWMSFPNSAPLDALTAIARDDFFDAVEIKSYGAEKEQAKAILDQSHLTVCFGAHPMQLKDKLNPNALDESERQKAEDALPEDIQRMVDERAQARKNKDWKRSDELRDAIKAAGYILEDSREGQKVRRSV